jgi:SSS family solute:Na+ symporter
LLTAGIFTIYTSIGGMWAVTMTDFVQFVILILGLLVIFPVSLAAVGGLEGLAQGLPNGFFSLIPQFEGKTTLDGVGYVVATLVVTGMTGIVGPDVYIRVWCAKDNRTAKNVLYAVGFGIVIGAIMLVLIGMAARVLNPDIAHEMAMPWMISHLLPAGVSGLVLVALMAAAISGAVPELVVCSSILARDVYQRVFDPHANQKKLLLVSRILTFLVGVAGMVMAVSLPNFMDLTYHCYRVFVPAIVPITIAAFYSKKTNEKSALISMLVGAATALFCIFMFPQSYLTFADPVIVGLIASTAALLLMNCVTKSNDPQRDVQFVDNAQKEIAAYKEWKKNWRAEKKAQKSA